MNYQDTLQTLYQQFDIVAEIDLNQWRPKQAWHPTWHQTDYDTGMSWLRHICKTHYREQFADNQRLIFKLTDGDIYVKTSSVGLILRNLQMMLNEYDISNFFVIVISTNPNLEQEMEYIKNISQDPVNITCIACEGDWQRVEIDHYPNTVKNHYQYNSSDPVRMSLANVSDRERFLLTESRTFCMYPWLHLHAWPSGQAFPCCHAEYHHSVGDCKTQSLQQIWNGDAMKKLRRDMLAEVKNPACTRCYEQEQSGFFSGRRSANKHHGHHVDRVMETKSDGHLDRFEMTYWDIRFSNLCNLRCRSCGHTFSSQWYQDQVKLAGPEWKREHQILNYAGRTETDMWEQLEPHLDYVEQIYFAGGEPLLMEEHYRILEELERRGRFDVRLIYNTNFTQVRLKDRCVFDYWKKFDSVAVGASLDAMGARAEYIRKGTRWNEIENNRRQMIETCPRVDFYISPTLSIMNAWHITEFHRDWVSKGLIEAQDLNVNILQDPPWYRIDIAPLSVKQHLKEKWEEHVQWLRPRDMLTRATVGFESAINFMMAQDNTKLIPEFWNKTKQLDRIRGERAIEALPELRDLK